MHLLEAKGISKTYSKSDIVKDLTLYLTTGEIVGLLGPNGAGKTTTFYMMVGLIKPKGGNIYLDGEDITYLPVYKRAQRGISYLPQEPSIFRKLSVQDNLRAVLEIKGLRREEIDAEVDRLLEEFNLSELPISSSEFDELPMVKKEKYDEHNRAREAKIIGSMIEKEEKRKERVERKQQAIARKAGSTPYNKLEADLDALKDKLESI